MPTFRKFFTRQMKWEKIVAAIAAIPGLDKLLLEDGDKLLLEDGDKMLLENGYLVEDDLNWANNTEAANNGWGFISTPSFGISAPPAPLLSPNIYSLRIDGSSDVAIKYFESSSVCWLFVAANIDSISSSPYIIRFLGTKGSVVAAVRFLSTGAVRSENGTSNNSSAGGTVSANTTYYIWMKYQRGTGSNGRTDVYVSTTQTIPTSPTISTTNGNAILNVSGVYISTAVTANAYYNKLRVSNVPIESDPV